MYQDPNAHLALHEARTARAAAGVERPLPQRARPPGRLRRSTAQLLLRAADRLATESAVTRARPRA